MLPAGFTRRTPQRWMSTLRWMLTERTRVICTCSRCGTWHHVELARYVILFGMDDAMSLWDCRPPCENPHCDGLSHFMASPGPTTPMRPLLSDPSVGLDDLPAEAWMAGWTGMERDRPWR